MDYRKGWVAILVEYWWYAEYLKTKDSTMPGSVVYLDRNSCSLGTLAPSPSVLFFFILFSMKIIWKYFQHGLNKMANACTLHWKYKPRFELPKNSVPRLHKVQYRYWHYGSKSHEITHAPPKPQNWTYSRLENKLQICLEVFMIFSQRSQVDRQHNHLRWKAALKDTVAGNLTHVTGGQLVHLCSDAVLLHQWFLREADMQHVTDCSHYPVSYD